MACSVASFLATGFNVCGTYLQTNYPEPNFVSNLNLDTKLKRMLSFTTQPTLQLGVATANDTDGLTCKEKN
jgi:hypothetical protein